MDDWKNTIVSPNTTIFDVIKVIDLSSLQIALVVDSNRYLVGTITDGDIRRAILNNISLNESADKIMSHAPITGRLGDGRNFFLEIMREKSLRHLPIIDDSGCLVGMEMLRGGAFLKETRDNPVIIMAGGLGTRLRPLTNECPKPLLEVGNKPILETILENFIDCGFVNFYFSINYKGNLIKNHFDNGSRWGVKIEYLEESEPMGTAGSLSLLPVRPSLPIIVMNGDILTKINFNNLLDFHNEHQARATMCVREYDIQIPFGVVQVDKHYLKSIEEKPMQHFFVNAGIYVINPDVLDCISDAYSDMPTIFESLINKNQETIVFPIREYWLDLGRMEDLTKARGEFNRVFE